MKCSLEQLITDVMARLGEEARPQSSLSSFPFPTTRDALALTVGSRLAAVGKSLILNAETSYLGDCETLTLEGEPSELPSSQYALDVSLPPDTLRVIMAEAAGWARPAVRVINMGNTGWERQWSSEAGIAGCREFPMAYLSTSGEGLKLRAVGSKEPLDSVTVKLWRLPVADSEGEFLFPRMLYPELIVGLLSF